MSDFFSRKELHRSRVYEWMQLYEVEHVINLAIRSPRWNMKTFLFDRGAGSLDFSERDRLVLELLQPHFARMLHAAKTRRLLKTALAELERTAPEASHGVVLLSPSNQIEFATPPARRLLRSYFGTERPRAVLEWLEGVEKPLVRVQGACRLTIHRTGEALFLEEHNAETELTAREQEVLSWVAHGKTNAEIAQLLWLAPSTVRKHLENVYEKLGVKTRTAAVARVFGAIDAEAR
ncbi:MAG: LuxR C-terminal-related transcriptional regulator [Actinomycetota bacterium]|nr:LuxR C-terminal-related transcriptional regulator [Actinomycetota bacterium]